jgi:hypothetical protein
MVGEQQVGESMSDDDLGGEVILGDPPEDEEGGPDVDTDDVEAS